MANTRKDNKKLQFKELVAVPRKVAKRITVLAEQIRYEKRRR